MYIDASLHWMPMEFLEGDRVEYNPVGGASAVSVGVIKRIITQDQVKLFSD